MEPNKNDKRRTEHPPDQMVVRKSADSNIGDVAAGDDPDEAGDKKEFFSRNFHASEYTPLARFCESTMNYVHLFNKYSHGRRRKHAESALPPLRPKRKLIL